MAAPIHNAYRFLTAPQVRRLHALQIAASSPTQQTMLESATDSPINKNLYGQTDVFQLAAILAEKVILNHPYQDGNKRTALFAADMFLKMNGYQLQTKMNDAEPDEGLADAHVFVASKQWTAEDLGKYYASVAKQMASNHEQEDGRI
ncbi:DOC family protein [Pochonia chlamydosporia 170]|uniref:DOC family protein n=1 Tax=Pochonia chlamydosporia 170 TaxID=1380566 RepID=A0A179FZD9_METCM|nr:DOC family protein [Pochonia chlamydosporia 170]OAQ71014.1 DOC family protein [Pochonia chlamydosporia 170]